MTVLIGQTKYQLFCNAHEDLVFERFYENFTKVDDKQNSIFINTSHVFENFILVFRGNNIYTTANFQTTVEKLKEMCNVHNVTFKII